MTLTARSHFLTNICTNIAGRKTCDTINPVSVLPYKDMSGTAPSYPSAYPLHRSKIIHIVRHGQGYHNVQGEIDRLSYLSYDYLDASLTPKGWQQVGALQKYLKSSGILDSVELVVSSPLTRTLQTATGAFGGEDIVNGETHKPLMVEGVGKAPRKAISSAGALPFVAVEWCREQIGIHPCDKRQPISVYRTLFPAVDFSEVEHDDDVLWKADVRETDDELYARARKFVQWLLKRKEKEIAVVSHSSFLFHLMTTFGDDCSPVVREELQALYANCEMRTVVLADRGAQDVNSSGSTDWPGGVPEGKDAPSY
ncbi:unnamed protein product [Calypogeia fissa]